MLLKIPARIKGDKKLMCPYKYYQVMRDSKDKKQWRYQMVQKAMKDGTKAAARAFNTSPQVVRKWLRRFNTEGYSALADRSGDRTGQTGSMA